MYFNRKNPLTINNLKNIRLLLDLETSGWRRKGCYCVPGLFALFHILNQVPALQGMPGYRCACAPGPYVSIS